MHMQGNRRGRGARREIAKCQTEIVWSEGGISPRPLRPLRFIVMRSTVEGATGMQMQAMRECKMHGTAESAEHAEGMQNARLRSPFSEAGITPRPLRSLRFNIPAGAKRLSPRSIQAVSHPLHTVFHEVHIEVHEQA